MRPKAISDITLAAHKGIEPLSLNENPVLLSFRYVRLKLFRQYDNWRIVVAWFIGFRLRIRALRGDDNDNNKANAA